MESALMALCRDSVRDLRRDDVLVPDGFARTLGSGRSDAEGAPERP
jgi:hypothetical protein